MIPRRDPAELSVADLQRTCGHDVVMRLTVVLYECLHCGLRAEVSQ